MAAEIVTHYDPDGTVTVLDCDWNATGRGLPPVSARVAESLGRHGGQLTNTRRLPRNVRLDLWINEAGDESALRSTLRELAYKFDPVRGLSTIRFTDPDGVDREGECFLAAGYNLIERLGSRSGPGLEREAVTFQFPDPHLYDTSFTSSSYTQGASSATWFDSQYLPFTLEDASLYDSGSVANSGDVEAWPVWDLTGPGTSITLANDTTGESLTVAFTLVDGETMTIDTRPASPGVTRGNGDNLFSYLTGSLWSLQKGTNQITISWTGADANSDVTLRYKRGYLMA